MTLVEFSFEWHQPLKSGCVPIACPAFMAVADILMPHTYLSRHPPDGQLSDSKIAAGRRYLQERALARNARKHQPPVRSARGAWDAPKCLHQDAPLL